MLRRQRRAAYREAMERELASGPATQFRRDPDLEGVAASTFRAADDPVTPAVLLLMDGEPFQIDGDAYHVDRVLRSSRGPQADLLVLRGSEYTRCSLRSVCRALQVRDLEELVDQDRVHLTSGRSARRFNLDAGWGRNGRTMGSLGFTFGGVA